MRASAFAGFAWRARAADTGLGVIAFTRANGLWLRNLPDGKPRLLVPGAKIDSPLFSPSGQWLTYFRDESLYLIPSAGGSPRALGKPGRGGPLIPTCQWFPHSDDLLVPGPSGLRIFSPSSGWTATIPHALPVAFSPDAREMVYSEDVTVGRGPGGEPIRTGRLCRIALAAPGQPKVIFSKYMVALFPALWIGDWVIFRWDPDFSASARADGLELFRVPAAGGTPQSLSLSVLPDADMLSLSAEGKLAISAGCCREDWQDRRIAVIDPTAATTAVRYLTGPNQAAVSPAWSPSGDRIAYSAGPSDHGPVGGGEKVRRILARRRIWIADAAGAVPPSVLTRDPLYRDEEPMWSADGSRILFCRMDLHDRKSLWLMDSSGSSLTQVADLYTDPGPFGVNGTWFGYYGHIDWRRMFDWHQ